MTEPTIEELMSQADELGIPYSPNIGLATLQGKISAYQSSNSDAEPETQEPYNGLTAFTNTSKANIFTTQGRCMPGKAIELDIEESSDYEGLEKL